MYLNQVPHDRHVRKYFYTMAAEALLDAAVLCSEGLMSNRMKVTSMFPEMHPEMDSYYRYVRVWPFTTMRRRRLSTWWLLSLHIQGLVDKPDFLLLHFHNIIMYCTCTVQKTEKLYSKASSFIV